MRRREFIAGFGSACVAGAEQPVWLVTSGLRRAVVALLSRSCLEYEQRRSGRHNRHKLESSVREQAPELCLGSLATTCGHDKHFQVGQEAFRVGLWLGDFRQHSFNDEESGVDRHAASTAAQNGVDAFVVAVVQNVLEQVDVAVAPSAHKVRITRPSAAASVPVTFAS